MGGRLRIVAFFALAMLALSACSSSNGSQATSSGGTASGSALFGEVVNSAKVGVIEGPWLIWDEGTCSFKETQDHPDTYTADTRKALQPLTIAYAPEDFVVPFVISNTDNIKEIAGKAGIDVKVFNNNYPSETDPLTAADNIVTSQPDGVLEANVIDTLYPAILKKLKSACLPVVTMYLRQQGYPAMGSSFSESGKAAGEYIAAKANDFGWNPSDVSVVECRDKAVGEEPNSMFPTAEDAIKSGFPGIPDGNFFVLDCPGTPKDAQRVMGDWLTGHPDVNKLVMLTIDDERLLGMNNAAAAAGRGTNDQDTMSVATGADQLGIEQLRKGRETASVAFFPERYGEYLLPLIEDILDGKPVPTFTATEVVTIDSSNIDQYYPSS